MTIGIRVAATGSGGGSSGTTGGGNNNNNSGGSGNATGPVGNTGNGSGSGTGASGGDKVLVWKSQLLHSKIKSGTWPSHAALKKVLFRYPCTLITHLYPMLPFEIFVQYSFSAPSLNKSF